MEERDLVGELFPWRGEGAAALPAQRSWKETENKETVSCYRGVSRSPFFHWESDVVFSRVTAD